MISLSSHKALNDANKGIDFPGLTVTIADLPLHTDLFHSGVHRFDELQVKTVDKTTTHLARPRQFVIVGIQKLIEQDKFVDFHDLRQLFIDLPHLFQDQFLDGRLLGKVHIGRIGDHTCFSPTPRIPEIDIDHRRQIGTSLAEDHGLLDKGTEFQTGLDEIRGKGLPAFVADDLLLAADDQQMAVAVKVAGVAGPEPALHKGRFGCLIILVIPLKDGTD